MFWPFLATSVAAIAFGTPGPAQHVTFADATLRAEITYRIAHDRWHDTGETAATPSIEEGSLVVTYEGKRRVYDLARFFPIHSERIILPEASANNCGAATPIVRSGRYLAVEAILAQKGCAPIAAFIDLRSGQIAENVVFDPSWIHRFDASPERFSGEPMTIVEVDTLSLPSISFDPAHPKGVSASWPYSVVHLKDSRARTHVVAFDRQWPTGATKAAHVLAAGSTVTLGVEGRDADANVFVRTFSGERLLHLDANGEARYDALQTPTPPDVAKGIRRNHWFGLASRDAERGNFEGAVAAFSNVIANDGATDATTRSDDSNTYARCRALASKVDAGEVTSGQASASFSSGCRSKAVSQNVIR